MIEGGQMEIKTERLAIREISHGEAQKIGNTRIAMQLTILTRQAPALRLRVQVLSLLIIP